MNKLASLMVVLLLCATSYSQKIERSLIGTMGTTFLSGGYQLSCSLGEAVILPSPSQTFSSPANAMIFTIGFQQPHVAKVGQLVHSENWVSAYPNPTTGWVRLDIHGDNFQGNIVKIFDAMGKQVAVKPFVFVNGSMDLRLDNLSSGTYMIAVTDPKLGNTVTTKIVKINK